MELIGAELVVLAAVVDGLVVLDETLWLGVEEQPISNAARASPTIDSHNGLFTMFSILDNSVERQGLWSSTLALTCRY